MSQHSPSPQMQQKKKSYLIVAVSSKEYGTSEITEAVKAQIVRLKKNEAYDQVNIVETIEGITSCLKELNDELREDHALNEAYSDGQLWDSIWSKNLNGDNISEEKLKEWKITERPTGKTLRDELFKSKFHPLNFQRLLLPSFNERLKSLFAGVDLLLLGHGNPVEAERDQGVKFSDGNLDEEILANLVAPYPWLFLSELPALHVFNFCCHSSLYRDKMGVDWRKISNRFGGGQLNLWTATNLAESFKEGFYPKNKENLTVTMACNKVGIIPLEWFIRRGQRHKPLEFSIFATNPAGGGWQKHLEGKGVPAENSDFWSDFSEAVRANPDLDLFFEGLFEVEFLGLKNERKGFRLAMNMLRYLPEIDDRLGFLRAIVEKTEYSLNQEKISIENLSKRLEPEYKTTEQIDEYRKSFETKPLYSLNSLAPDSLKEVKGFASFIHPAEFVVYCCNLEYIDVDWQDLRHGIEVFFADGAISTEEDYSSMENIVTEALSKANALGYVNVANVLTRKDKDLESLISEGKLPESRKSDKAHLAFVPVKADYNPVPSKFQDYSIEELNLYVRYFSMVVTGPRDQFFSILFDWGSSIEKRVTRLRDLSAAMNDNVEYLKPLSPKSEGQKKISDKMNKAEKRQWDIKDVYDNDGKPVQRKKIPQYIKDCKESKKVVDRARNELEALKNHHGGKFT